MNTLGPPPYEARIVPALHRIQHKYGYLKSEELKRFSAESGIPLYRLQAVASFFPHLATMPVRIMNSRVFRLDDRIRREALAAALNHSFTCCS